MAPSLQDKTLKWTLEEIKLTPSKGDGIADLDERLQRFLACEYARKLIRTIFATDRQQEDCSNRVQMLACYYIQVFYMFRSLRQDELKTVAVAGTFLACKVVDLPKRMKNILRALNQMRAQGGEAELGEEEQRVLCDRVLRMEFFILRIIRFDFDLVLPLDFLAPLTEALLDQLTRCSSFCNACTKGAPVAEAKTLHSQLLSIAERFLLDSFMGFAPVLSSPKVIAAAALAIATRFVRRELSTSELCRLLPLADDTLDETDVKHVVDEILGVFRTKNRAQASGAAPGASPAGPPGSAPAPAVAAAPAAGACAAAVPPPAAPPAAAPAAP